MAFYDPINWTVTEKITPIKLRKMEEQYERALDSIGTIPRESTTDPLMAEKLATAPTGNEARIYFNTTTGKMNFYDGISWKEA